MTKLTIPAVLFMMVCFSTPSMAFDPALNGSELLIQVHQGETMEMNQSKTKDSTQAINTIESDGGTLKLIYQHVEGDRVDMNQKKANDSVQAVNNVELTGADYSGVGQVSNIDEVSMTQTGGKNNTQAVNRIKVGR